jgi:hypothetical protein
MCTYAKKRIYNYTLDPTSAAWKLVTLQVWAALGAVKVEQDTEGLGTDGEAGPILVEDSGTKTRTKSRLRW